MSVFLSLLPMLVSVLSPVVVAGVKKVVPKVPKVLLPLASVAVGTAGAVLSDHVFGSALGASGGAVAGAVGVAVREVLDQVKAALSAE
jgi:hypothetical protein